MIVIASISDDSWQKEKNHVINVNWIQASSRVYQGFRLRCLPRCFYESFLTTFSISNNFGESWSLNVSNPELNRHSQIKLVKIHDTHSIVTNWKQSQNALSRHFEGLWSLHEIESNQKPNRPSQITCKLVKIDDTHCIARNKRQSRNASKELGINRNFWRIWSLHEIVSSQKPNRHSQIKLVKIHDTQSIVTN